MNGLIEQYGTATGDDYFDVVFPIIYTNTDYCVAFTSGDPYRGSGVIMYRTKSVNKVNIYTYNATHITWNCNGF